MTHKLTQKLFYDTHFFEISKPQKMALQSALPAAVNCVWSRLRHTRFLLLTFRPPFYTPICRWCCLSCNSANNRPCWLSLVQTAVSCLSLEKPTQGEHGDHRRIGLPSFSPSTLISCRYDLISSSNFARFCASLNLSLSVLSRISEITFIS